MSIRYSLLLLCLLVFSACLSEKQKAKKAIEAAEAQHKETMSPEAAQNLCNLYTEYTQSYPDDHKNNATYLYRAAGLAYRMNRFTDAITWLKQSIKNHHEAPITPASVQLLGATHEQMQQIETASTIYHSLLLAFPDYEKNNEVKTFVIGVPPLNQYLDSLRKTVFINADGGPIDLAFADEYLNALEYAALINPKGEESPGYLLYAAETARSLNADVRAEELYQLFIARYPKHPKLPDVLFLYAFLLDEEGKDKEAKTRYESFLAKYPTNEFADDARFLLENLGKSDQEIMDELLKKQE